MEVEKKLTVKEELEIAKLRLEIKNEQKSIFCKPSFYAALSPILVSAFALFWAYQTGLFEAEQKNLDADKKILEYDIRNFTKTKESLANKIDQLDSSYQNLKNDYNLTLLSLNSEKENVSIVNKNLTSLYFKYFISLIQTVVTEKIESSKNDTTEVKNWITNIKKEYNELLHTSINIVYQQKPPLTFKAIPDSINRKFFSIAKSVINTSNFYSDHNKNTDLMLLKTFLMDIHEYQLDCNFIYSDLSRLIEQINKEENREIKGELALDYVNVSHEYIDCIFKQNRFPKILENELKKIKYQILNQYILALQRKLS